MQENNGVTDFVHPKLDEEVTAIGGHYVLTKEVRESFNDQSFLYFTGYAVIDTSCCGAGGCAYAFVPGLIVEWKYKNTPDNHPVSRIKPVRDPAIQREIKRLIKDREIVNQVNFD